MPWESTNLQEDLAGGSRLMHVSSIRLGRLTVGCRPPFPRLDLSTFSLRHRASRAIESIMFVSAQPGDERAADAEGVPTGPALDQAFIALRESVLWGNQSIVDMGQAQGAAR